MKKEILLDNLCRLRSDIRICGISIRDKQTDDNYIKALDEVIEIIEKEPLKDIRNEIENVKNNLSVTPQPKWIPVSARLPNCDEYIKNNGLFNVSDGNRSYSEWFDIYDKQRFGEHTMDGFRVDYAVIAWMPLPETYELQESEDNE